MSKTFILALLFAFSVAVNASCSASASISARSGARWVTGDKTFQLYDLTVTNDGSCIINNVGLSFGLPTGAAITEHWNLLADNLYYLLQNFPADGINAASAFNGAGFVVSMPTASADTAAPISVQVYGAACPSSCSSTSTPAPSSSDETSSAAPAESSDESSAPVADCTIVASVEKDASTQSWTDAQGRTVSVYRLKIQNTGTSALKDYVTSFTVGLSGEIVSMWNLEGTRGGYRVTGFGESLPAGATYTGAGLIIANAAETIAVTPYGSNCVA